MRKIVVGALLLILILLSSQPVLADDPIVGEIRLWAGISSPYPDGWAIADGHYEPISSPICLEIGSNYGSAPAGYCKVPDLRGRVPVGYESRQTEFDNVGETGGAKTHTLTINEMPAHSHTIGVASGNGAQARASQGNNNGVTAFGSGSAGAGESHNNLQPYIVLRYIIYTGVYSNPTPTPTSTPTPTATATPTNPGGQQTGPITGTITGSLVITQALPSYAFTTTLTTGNGFVWSREATYGEIIAGAGGVGVSLVLIFYFVAKFARRPAAND